MTIDPFGLRQNISDRSGNPVKVPAPTNLNLNEITITPREQEVMLLLAHGFSSRRIAAELGISFHTVESFRKKLLQKFKVRTTIEMVVRATSVGEWHRIDQRRVSHPDARHDSGVQSVLVVNIQDATTLTNHAEYRSLRPVHKARTLAVAMLSQHHAREVTSLHDDSLMAVFDSPVNSMQCALQIQSRLIEKKDNGESDELTIRFKIGLSTGQSITCSDDFFGRTATLAWRLCSIACPNALLISSQFQDYCNIHELKRNAADATPMRLLSVREENFICSLYSISEEKLADENFTVDVLSKLIGMSRPQLYRKMISLTGRSPNDFLRDLRMDKALSLIKKKAGNISEIALEVGYHNPSYFAKCFKIRYGCLPSRFVV